MYQLNWGLKNFKSDVHGDVVYPPFFKANIRSLLHMTWEEHCIECAVPECYHHCALYVPRTDGACARFVHGITRNTSYWGLYKFGADITFRKWAKLEVNLSESYPEPYYLHRFASSNKWYTSLSKVFHRFNPAGQNTRIEFDFFVIECFSHDDQPLTLHLEYFTEKERLRTPKFKWAGVVVKGRNLFKIPFDLFNIASLEGYIYVHPEVPALPKRLIFTWLDFIKEKSSTPVSLESKIKCVVWDLDNTIWKGTISEEKVNELLANVQQTIEVFDKRGIIQSICSKNDANICMDKLKVFGLDKYFLYPQINWGRKSENIKKIAASLNISLNSIAFIDDSPFERDEVKLNLPMIRVFEETSVPELPFRCEFKPSHAVMGENRRISYLDNIQRNKQLEAFTGDYDQFLVNCCMTLKAFELKSEHEILRAWELMQRSNQLNLSSHRYSLDSFKALLKNDKCLSLGITCKDRFGDYGLISFISVRVQGGYPVIMDLAISCRVAQKKVEHTIISALAIYFSAKYDKMCACLIKTEKNGPLRKSFEELPFKVCAIDAEAIQLEMNLPANLPAAVMEIEMPNMLSIELSS